MTVTRSRQERSRASEARAGGRGPDAEGSPAERASEVFSRLARARPTRRKARRDPLDELVLTVLSQNTSDVNSDLGWEGLRARFPTWQALLEAPPAAVEASIRPAGLARQKAATIRRILERLEGERGDLALDHLDAMSDEDALAYLTSIKGVGVKTAACVLCFSLGRAVLPVDTHVARLARRLGLAPESAGADRIHEILNTEVPEELRAQLHLLLIDHGRGTCTARRPACSRCLLAAVCPRIGVVEAG